MRFFENLGEILTLDLLRELAILVLLETLNENRSNPVQYLHPVGITIVLGPLMSDQS